MLGDVGREDRYGGGEARYGGDKARGRRRGEWTAVAEALRRVRGTWRGRGTRGVEWGPWAPGEKCQGFFCKNTTAQLISGRREYVF
jgi:hypothetical protein